MEGGGGGGEEEKTKKRLYVTESLGWLTESSIMPKKHRNIEGVGASSIFELKAQLYKTQEEAKKSKELAPDIEYHRAKKKIVANDVLSQKNSGVDARAHKDKLELKAVKDGSNSYAALEKKAELYDKLVRGELPDEEEKEKYCVDFFQKGLVEDKLEQPSQGGDTSAISVENENDDPEASMLFSSKQIGPGRTAGELNNDEHKRFVREVHTEATQAREKASVLKLQRQEQATARREKLRQAYLRKQLEKLTAAAKTKDS